MALDKVLMGESPFVVANLATAEPLCRFKTIQGVRVFGDWKGWPKDGDDCLT